MKRSNCLKATNTFEVPDWPCFRFKADRLTFAKKGDKLNLIQAKQLCLFTMNNNINKYDKHNTVMRLTVKK
jgi:hypothetical protein